MSKTLSRNNSSQYSTKFQHIQEATVTYTQQLVLSANRTPLSHLVSGISYPMGICTASAYTPKTRSLCKIHDVKTLLLPRFSSDFSHF